jgi:hypothetical protein
VEIVHHNRIKGTEYIEKQYQQKSQLDPLLADMFGHHEKYADHNQNQVDQQDLYESGF